MSRKLVLALTAVFFILGGQVAFAGCDGDHDKDKKKDDGGSETYTAVLFE